MKQVRVECHDAVAGELVQAINSALNAFDPTQVGAVRLERHEPCLSCGQTNIYAGATSCPSCDTPLRPDPPC